MYATYLFADEQDGTVQSCYQEHSEGRFDYTTTWCEVRFDYDGRASSSEIEADHPLPEGTVVRIRVAGPDDIEAPYTAKHFSWLLLPGLLLMLAPYVWGWPKQWGSRRR